MRDFISVAPFFAWQRLHITCRRKEPPPSTHRFNKERDIAGRYSPTERIGVNATEAAVVKELGWIFREQAVSDMGIDAHIEPVTDGNPTGQLIGVQIKTGTSHFTEKEDYLVYYGTLVHLEYWLRHALPVILVAHLPESDATYWVHVNKDLTQRTEKAWKIEIPKSQKLDESSARKLLAVLDGTPLETKNRNLVLHTGNMKFIKEGGKLATKGGPPAMPGRQ